MKAQLLQFLYSVYLCSFSLYQTELIQLKEKGFLPPDHRPRRQEGREGWSNLRDAPSHRSTHSHDGTPFGMGPGFGPFPGRFSHGYPVGSDFGPQPYPQGSYLSGPYMDPGRPPFASGWMVRCYACANDVFYWVTIIWLPSAHCAGIRPGLTRNGVCVCVCVCVCVSDSGGGYVRAVRGFSSRRSLTGGLD